MHAFALRGWTRVRIRTEIFSPRGFLSEKLLRFPNRTFFSSSSTPSKKEPRLSNRSKRDLVILAAGICGALGYHLNYRDCDWENDVWMVQKKLIASANPNIDRNNNSVDIIGNKKELISHEDNSFSNLPPSVVLSYIEKSLQQQISSLRLPSSLREQVFRPANRNATGTSHREPSSYIVTAQQSGEFFAAQQWYPFEATLMAAASATNPGFVWDARTTILKLSNHVLEYYITHNNNEDANDGTDNFSKCESNTITKLWGKYPLIQIEEEDPYILFWLALTPLFPTVLLSHRQLHEREGTLIWNSNESLFTTNRNEGKHLNNGQVCVSAQLRSSINGANTTYLVEFFFGEEDNLLYKIKVTSPHWSEEQTWQAVYGSYKQYVVVADCEEETKIEDERRQQQDQKSRLILVPSTIEIGKGEGDQYRSHFKINTNSINYKL